MVKKKRKIENKDLDACARDRTIPVAGTQSKCLVPGLIQKIREKVPQVNQITALGSLLAILYVATHIDTIKDKDLGTRFYQQCCALFYSNRRNSLIKSTSDNGLLEVYKRLTRTQDRVLSYDNVKSMVVYDCGNLKTVLETYNTWVLDDHIVLYLRAKYRLEKKGHAGWMRDCVKGWNRVKPATFPEMENLESILSTERTLFEHHSDNGTFTQYRYKMIQAIVAASTSERTYKSFTLLPMRQMGPKFITFDQEALVHLGLFTKDHPWRHDYVPNRKETRSYEKFRSGERMTSLSDWFDIPDPQKGWNHQNTMKTNGFEFHFLYDKNTERGYHNQKKRVKRENQAEEQDFDLPYVTNLLEMMGDEFDIQDETQFVGADPNHYNLFFSTTKNKDGSYENRKYTKSEYKDKSGRFQVQRRAENLKKDDETFQKMQNELSDNHLNTVNIEKLFCGVQVYMKNYTYMHKKMYDRDLMKFKFIARGKEQRTQYKFLNRLTYNKKKFCGLGDGSKMNGFKGTSQGGPSMKLKRLARKCNYPVGLIDEYNTSAQSPCCDGGEMTSHEQHYVERTIPRKTPMFERKKNHKILIPSDLRLMFENAKKMSLHGVRRCSTCFATWNRDLASARNIYNLLMSLVQGRSRPTHFCRGNLQSMISATSPN